METERTLADASEASGIDDDAGAAALEDEDKTVGTTFRSIHVEVTNARMAGQSGMVAKTEDDVDVSQTGSSLCCDGNLLSPADASALVSIGKCPSSLDAVVTPWP